jgi:hypothetical protein
MGALHSLLLPDAPAADAAETLLPLGAGRVVDPAPRQALSRRPDCGGDLE